MVAVRKLYRELTTAEAAAIVQGVVPAWWSVSLVRQVWEDGSEVPAPHKLAQPAPMPLQPPVGKAKLQAAVARQHGLASPGLPRAASSRTGEGGGQKRGWTAMEDKGEAGLPGPSHGLASPGVSFHGALPAGKGTCNRAIPYVTRAGTQPRQPGGCYYSPIDVFHKDHLEEVKEVARELRDQEGSRQPIHLFMARARWRLWAEADEDVRSLYKQRSAMTGQFRKPRAFEFFKKVHRKEIRELAKEFRAQDSS